MGQMVTGLGMDGWIVGQIDTRLGMNGGTDRHRTRDGRWDR